MPITVSAAAEMTIICRPIGTPLKTTMRSSVGSGRSRARLAPASLSGCLRA